MIQTLVRAFRFELLKLSELLECSRILLRNVFTPVKAQPVGLGKTYDDLVDLDAKFETIMKRNAALFETEVLTENVDKLYRLLGLFENSLRVA